MNLETMNKWYLRPDAEALFSTADERLELMRAHPVLYEHTLRKLEELHKIYLHPKQD